MNVQQWSRGLLIAVQLLHFVLSKAKVLSRNPLVHDIIFVLLLQCCYRFFCLPELIVARCLPVALFRECDSWQNIMKCFVKPKAFAFVFLSFQLLSSFISTNRKVKNGNKTVLINKHACNEIPGHFGLESKVDFQPASRPRTKSITKEFCELHARLRFRRRQIRAKFKTNRLPATALSLSLSRWECAHSFREYIFSSVSPLLLSLNSIRNKFGN